jgi:perosamine synthetase
MRNTFDINDVRDALSSCLPSDQGFIGLHEPYFGGNEWIYVKECLDTRWVSSVGKYVDQFEKQLAEYTGVKRAVAVVNGTAALHVALMLSGVERDDEVLLPALTFVATANAVAYCGAVCHFVDSEEKTLGLDPHKLDDYLKSIADVRSEGCYNKQTGRRIKAVLPMHTFGHPVDLDPLAQVCQRFKLELIEDAAESLGSFYKGQHTGNWGKLSTLSFNGNKTITTGGGGAILTNDEELGKLVKHITTTAKIPHKWAFYHDQTGFNYRLPNINAALGCAQLEQLPSFLEQKRALAERYREAFAAIKGITFYTEPEFARSNYWLHVLLLDRSYVNQRDALLEATNASGIMTRPAWNLMHTLPMYQACPRMDLSTAERLEARLINIPSSVFL